jgi:hypothetical protein
MKHVEVVHAAAFSLLLMATTILGYAQHDDKRSGPDRPAAQAQTSGTHRGQQKRVQDSPRQSTGHPQRVETRQASATEQVQAEQHPQGQRLVQTDEQRIAWQQHGASSFDTQHQTWTQRGGYQGFRVPDASFTKSFGRDHSFHVFGLPYMEVEGRPRFQYGGYWFSMMEPYPEYWGADWYRNDDMYVDYDGGGYYLYDRRFSNRPGVAVSISF